MDPAGKARLKGERIEARQLISDLIHHRIGTYRGKHYIEHNSDRYPFCFFCGEDQEDGESHHITCAYKRAERYLEVEEE